MNDGSEKNANVSWLLNFRISVFMKSAVRPCLQGGRVTLVLGLPKQEDYPSTRVFLLFLQGRWGFHTLVLG